jgi:5-methylcytosine-specific restriction endonuclease McrA
LKAPSDCTVNYLAKIREIARRIDFDYPDPQAVRRHAPSGYANYESFRPWLRDEFTFRCAYCLKREQWGQLTGEFDIDHFLPRRIRPDLVNQYANLVYACRRCNAVKQRLSIGDPFVILRAPRIKTLADGTVVAADAAAVRIIEALDLNSPKLVEWRLLLTRTPAFAPAGRQRAA